MQHSLKNILYLDIETVSGSPVFEEIDERLQQQWLKKAGYLKRDEEIADADFYFERAGIFAEFGKIIVIGLGFFTMADDGITFRVRHISGDDEAAVLKEFKNIVEKFDQDSLKLCAHNGREFDFPYLSRRMLINGLSLPSALNLSGKKPWEVNHLDTMDLWKFGDWKHYTSLELLATVFGIESSKSDIDGSMVNKVYHQDKNLGKIAEYCMNDVIVTAQLYAKLKNINLDNLKVVKVD